MVHTFRCHYNHKHSKLMDQVLKLKALSSTTHDHVRSIIRNILYIYLFICLFIYYLLISKTQKG